MTVLQMLVTVRRTQGETTNTLTHLCCCILGKATESKLYVHCGPHLQLPQKEIHTPCVKSSMCAHGTEIRGRNFEYFKTSVELAR